ncbi:ustiloxin B cluster transcription factor ustR [Cladobotryum mycophilum]|uniref:Ustiloxin B cluster transcription factor ustR n=1 Tax=Cladobotryum mycophilum TaxID=491253 RepID=A0ABR0SJ19_9HYPO
MSQSTSGENTAHEMALTPLVIPSDASCLGSADLGADCLSPAQTDPSLPISPLQDLSPFDSLNGFELSQELPIAPFFMDDVWTNGNDGGTLEDLATLPLPSAPKDKMEITLMGFSDLARASHLGIDASENEIHLLTTFIEDTFSRQYSSCKAPSITQKSWLLCLLLRSPTFYNASISMSAYYLHLGESNNANARDLALKSYQMYRDAALRSFDELDMMSPSIYGERIICGVHIAQLEALGKNMRSCQLYLDRVGQFIAAQGCFLEATLVSGRRERRASTTQLTTSGALPLTPDASPSTPDMQPSPMEHKAAVFFSVIFIWNDILCTTIARKVPCAADVYRKLLADEEFSLAFKHMTGCETWNMIAIIDATALEMKKRMQLTQGNLSIRELVSQADKIQAAVESEIERLSSIPSPPQSHTQSNDETSLNHASQSIVFGHAVLIHLNTIVSGALSGVPEIHQSIDRAIPAWEMLLPTINPKYLAWAYCTSASLATGSHRDVFRRTVAELPMLEVGVSSLREFKHVVEECWKETDRRSSDHSNSPCDWKDVLQRSNLNILFV